MAVTLRLLDPVSGSIYQTELLCCAYTPDGAFVLSGGSDGHLRLWETAAGGHIAALRTGEKPVLACAVSPDGKQLVSGGLDGLLAFWDALVHMRVSMFLAHPRPVSGIVFSLDARCVGTSSWDNTLAWWTSVREQKGQALTGHRDIVAGVRLTPDGQNLLSWSHDGTVRLWDLNRFALRSEMRGHTSKVFAGAVSPDGRWAATGAVDGNLRLWDLQAGRGIASVNVDDEIVACLFLLDGETLVVVDRFGRITLHVAPGLGRVGELITKVPSAAAALSPASNQIAIAGGDGRVRLLAVEGIENVPLQITSLQTLRRKAKGLQKLFGGTSLTYTYTCVCPACQTSCELPTATAGQTIKCAGCRRSLRIVCIAPVSGEK